MREVPEEMFTIVPPLFLNMVRIAAGIPLSGPMRLTWSNRWAAHGIPVQFQVRDAIYLQIVNQVKVGAAFLAELLTGPLPQQRNPGRVGGCLSSLNSKYRKLTRLARSQATISPVPVSPAVVVHTMQRARLRGSALWSEIRMIDKMTTGG